MKKIFSYLAVGFIGALCIFGIYFLFSGKDSETPFCECFVDMGFLLDENTTCYDVGVCDGCRYVPWGSKYCSTREEVLDGN